jgi:hypothetical protein
MFALVESGSITKLMNGNKGIKIGDIQYPSSFFTTVYSEAERNAVGVYTVTYDYTNFKNVDYYANTDMQFAYDSSGDKVVGSYGTATGLPVADTKWTQSEIDAGQAPTGADTNTVKTEGLKTRLIRRFNEQAATRLSATDWYVVKATEVGSYNVPSNITTYRAAVRTKVNSMETSINNCADAAAIETLLTYVKQEDDTMARPLGEFPDEVV